jgi:hypothetical protein
MATDNLTDPSSPASSVNHGALLRLCDAWELKAEALAEQAAALVENQRSQTGALFQAKCEERSACAHELRVFVTTAHEAGQS